MVSTVIDEKPRGVGEGTALEPCGNPDFPRRDSARLEPAARNFPHLSGDERPGRFQ